MIQYWLLLAATLCYASFTWGMVSHFQRSGEVTPAMKRTALIGVTSAALQFVGLASHLNGQPLFGLVGYLVGWALFWAAVRVSRKKLAACGQGQTSSTLLQHGPYHYIRHPFYTAYNLAWLSGVVATGWWPLILCAACMGWIYETSARAEEAGFAQGPLAAEYRQYKQKTGKYLPGI